MEGTRYEFGGTGMFHALELLEACKLKKKDIEDYKYAKNIFERDLDVPTILAPGNKVKTRSYFTPEGLEAFSLELDILYNLFEKYCTAAGFGEMEEIKEDISQDTIIYQDEYQILVKA